MKPLNLTGEYWFTNADNLLHAAPTGDYNHEGHVMEHIITEFCEVLGRENTFGTDAVWFRTELYDETSQGDGEDDELLDQAIAKMLARGDNPDMVADMRTLVGGGQKDAREFAINYWGWVRISQDNVECKDLTPKTLKRVHTALSRAYEEEHGDDLPADRTASVSRFRGVCYEMKTGDLEKGKHRRDDRSFGRLNQAARAQVRKLDLASQPACYGETIGG